VLQLLIWLQAHITAYTQAVGKHHAKQFILPVRTACMAHLKIAYIRNMKHILVSNGRRVRTHNQSPRPPSDLQPYLGAHPTPAMQQDTETSSAGQPSP